MVTLTKGFSITRPAALFRPGPCYFDPFLAILKIAISLGKDLVMLMTGPVERLDLTNKEPKLWLQTDTTVLSYDGEKKATQETLLTSRITN